MLLEGKRVIVTGGLTGIGKATVLACASHGATVVSMSRKEPAHPSAVAMLEEAQAIGVGSVSHMAVDITDQSMVFEVFDAAVAQMGGVDVLIHCAGLEQNIPAELLTRADVQEMIDIHLMGTIFTNQAVFKYMRETGGSIVNHASIAGVEGQPNMPAYSAAKGAVIGFSRNIAKDWAKYMIRVNMACPAVMTPLVQDYVDSLNPEAKAVWDAWLAATVPLGGALGDPKDAADVNVFLASDLSRFVHGQLVPVDGGMFFTR